MTSPFYQNLKNKALKVFFFLLLLCFLLPLVYLLFAYHFSYSKGESVGFVQKLSYKGWVCKTWEGEQIRSIANLQTAPDKFIFTVRDDAVAEKINQTLGEKVVLEYEEHRGLPGCLGDTSHFIVNVKAAPTPPAAPAAPLAEPLSAAPMTPAANPTRP
jgi:hypothetical protein